MDKDGIINEMANLAHQVQEGVTDPIQAHIALYEVKKVAEEMLTSIKDDVIDLAESKGKDYCTGGYKVNVQTRTNWSYKHSQMYLEKEKQLANIKAQMRYKANNLDVEIVTEDGEVVQPASQTHTTFVKLETLNEN